MVIRSFFYTFSIILLFKNKNFYSKSIFCLVTVSIFFLQINSSIVPFIKEKILKTDNYQNLIPLTVIIIFIIIHRSKKLLKIDFVGVDPMVAVYRGLKVIDGYHNTYPLSYKRQFRKIIEPELNIHPVFKVTMTIMEVEFMQHFIILLTLKILFSTSKKLS